MTDRPALHVNDMLRVLDEHDVDYVIIGGVAGRTHGDPTLTYDLDITPDPSTENLTRLASALDAMNVGLRVPDLEEPIPFGFDARSIGRFTTMATRGELGDLDIVLRPDGIPGGYEQLAANAIREPGQTGTVVIASLDDLIASRHAAAAKTGLQRYTTAAQRLTELQSERQQPAPPDVHRASFPDAPSAATQQPPRSDQRDTPRRPPEARGPDFER